ncbi:MAG: hypothetical protein ACR2QW_02540 [bacterium]
MTGTEGSFFKNKLATMSVTPILVYAVFCILGLVEFKLWFQVTYIWENISKTELTLTRILFDPAGVRFLLLLPFFKLGEWLGISYNWLFSITVPLLIWLITYFLSLSIQRLYGETSSQKRAIVFIGVSLFFISISLFMNGRMIFAFAGSSILTWSLLNWDNNRDKSNLLAVIAAIFLSCMSRGTLLVAITSFYFFLAVNIAIANPSIYRRRIFLVYATLLVVLMPYMFTMVLSLLDYFGGGIDAIGYMLSHGYGAIVLQPHFIIILVAICVLLAFGYAYRNFLYRNWILASLMFFSLAGGMFGISTALTILPPLLVAASVAMLEFAGWFENRKSESILKR